MGGSGKGRIFQHSWKPSAVVTKVIAFPGDYEIAVADEDGGSGESIKYNYGFGYQHWSNLSKMIGNCTAGLVHSTLYGRNEIVPGHYQCAGCEALRQGANIQNRKRYLLNLVLLGYWHEVEEVGKSGGKFRTWKKCKGKDACKLCANRVPRQFGRRVYWSPGPGHFRGLFNEVEVRLGGHCALCGGELRPVKFICPACRKVIAKHRELEDHEALVYKDPGVDCPKCSYSGPMVEGCKCKGCSDPAPYPLSLWGNIIHLFKSGEDLESTIGIKDFSVPSDKLLARIKDLTVPFDIEEVFDKKSIKEQVAHYKLSVNPYDAVEGSDRSAHSSWDDEDDE